MVKITRNGVEYTSKCDIAQYTIRQLTRRAMQDVGRFVLYNVRREVRGINRYLQKSRHAPNRYQMWIRKKENDLILGIENTKQGAVSAWWADQAELGTHNQPRRAILHTTVMQNIRQIVEIESQYLEYMNDEVKALDIARNTAEEDVAE